MATADGHAPGPERDRQLDAVLIGGREPVSIVVVDYDPEWPARFEQVGAGIYAALGATALRVEHIGSTSVPGLAAKPIIDVLLLVPDIEKESAFAPALEASGLALRVREPGHRMFRTPGKDVHVHVYGADDQAVSAYLDLRLAPGRRGRSHLVRGRQTTLGPTIVVRHEPLCRRQVRGDHADSRQGQGVARARDGTRLLSGHRRLRSRRVSAARARRRGPCRGSSASG